MIKSRVLLTGGTGFFGRSLLRNFLSRGLSKKINICVISRDPLQFQSFYPDLVGHDGISFIQADIEDRQSLPWDHQFTHVLHAATDSTVGPQLTPLQRFNQIIQGTTNILDLAIATGAHRFLLTSSGGIYGPQPPELDAIPEDWHGSPPLDQPSTAYSQGKRAAEHLCTLYHEAHGLETVIARCFAFVGPDLPIDVHFAIGNFIRDALHADEITVNGDGSPLRTYMDQRDLAYWLWFLLEEGQAGEAYNVGSDEVISIRELAHLVRDLISPSKHVRVLGTAEASVARNRYIPDIRKAQRSLNLRSHFHLSDAILNSISLLPR